MNKPSFKLVYFEERGKIDLIKLILYYFETNHESLQLKPSDWQSYKSCIPFEQLPALVINNTTIISHFGTISRYLAKLFNISGRNEHEIALCDMIFEQLNECLNQIILIRNESDNLRKCLFQEKFINEILTKTLNGFEQLLQSNKQHKFIIGNNLTWSDLALVTCWEWLDDKAKTKLDSYELVKTHYKLIGSLPKVFEWYKKQKPLGIIKKA